MKSKIRLQREGKKEVKNLKIYVRHHRKLTINFSLLQIFHQIVTWQNTKNQRKNERSAVERTLWKPYKLSEIKSNELQNPNLQIFKFFAFGKEAKTLENKKTGGENKKMIVSGSREFPLFRHRKARHWWTETKRFKKARCKFRGGS